MKPLSFLAQTWREEIKKLATGEDFDFKRAGFFDMVTTDDQIRRAKIEIFSYEMVELQNFKTELKELIDQFKEKNL